MASTHDRSWVDRAIRHIEADLCRSSDTHLIRVPLPKFPGITLYLKDESTHPSGSLKHRLARSLILYGLCNGWIGPETVLIEATSGSTAVSEAYFARLLGLQFIAVAPRSTSVAKIEEIRSQGGTVHFVEDARRAPGEARRLADACGGHFLDQFTFAERATDWRGNNNIAESIFGQMALEETPLPTWIVCGAGTGGTSATLGRYIRFKRKATRLCVADPAGSVFHRHFTDRTVKSIEGGCATIIEGIGRAQVEPSFIPSVIDRMVAVPDALSIGAMRALSRKLERRVGGSTGTNVAACMELVRELSARGERGSIVTLLCDSGRRYEDTYFSDTWLAERGVEWQCHAQRFFSVLSEEQ
jgi:cysteine synthase